MMNVPSRKPVSHISAILPSIMVLVSRILTSSADSILSRRHLGEIKGFALLLPYFEAEVAHNKIKEDVNWQRDRYYPSRGLVGAVI